MSHSITSHRIILWWVVSVAKKKEKKNTIYLPATKVEGVGEIEAGLKNKLKQFANCDEAFLQGLVKGTKLCLNPYFFGWLEKWVGWL